MDELDRLKETVKQLNDRFDHITKMSIFLDKEQYISAISQAVREATREDEKIAKLHELVILIRFCLLAIILSAILITSLLFWLAE